MARGRHSALTPFPIALVVVFVVGMLPARFSGWVSIFREPVTFLVRPISDPLARLSRPSVIERDDPALLELERQRNELEQRLALAHDRIGELERLITDMQGGIALAPELSLEMLAAPVTGSVSNDGASLLRVGAGTREGVVPRATVGVVRGVYLIGRVVSVESRTCSLLPFTTRQSGLARGLVMSGEEDGSSLRCFLEASGEGDLIGDMEASVELEDVRVGQLVRLDDDEWPASAQMLVLGRVTRVDRRENGRVMIRVEPEVDPARVSDVVLRIPLQGGAT
ncbi:MAG: rod shape-determining protein MreC [Phycisphaerales bacterium JB043]